MVLSAGALAPVIKPVGNNPGWILTFPREENGVIVDDPDTFKTWSADYYIDLRATLASGLDGGSYEFVIEGMTDADYGKIAGRAGAPLRFYLYYQDTEGAVGASVFTPVVDLVTELQGPPDKPEYLVAELVIVRVSRRVGARKYEAVIEARERVFHRLQEARISDADVKSLTGKSLQETITLLAQQRGITAKPYGDDLAKDVLPNRMIEKGRRYLDVFRALESRLEQLTHAYGRGPYLIRDGKLHFGKRSSPLDSAEKIQKLTVRAGMLEAEALSAAPLDAGADVSDELRRRYQLTLKGRPDLKPGMIVYFDPPAEEALTAGGPGLADLFQAVTSELLPVDDSIFSSDAVYLYVESVRHRMGRTSGFVTTVTGVAVKDAANPWDVYTPQPTRATNESRGGGSGEERSSRAMTQQVQRSVDSLAFPEVGQVRNSTSTTEEEQPAPTATVWAGLVARDDQQGQANDLPFVVPPSARLTRVPYLTPFAWGKCGLILPRYPGARVLLAYRRAQADDPVDLGALFEPAAFSSSNAQPGDWWLILPVGVDEAARASVPDTQESINPHTGAVSQDLIDADGNRVIELAEFTVRVGRGSLRDAGERPERPDDVDSITVEHVDGKAKVVLDKDGNITLSAHEGKATIVLKSDGSLTIETDGDLKLKAGGDIGLEAANVNVKVSGKMDVTN